MRILHLAYEDPRQPGSGGGSVRTREINRRLGERHEITALVAAYPGAAERFEDGVRWIPIGSRTGTKLDRLSYFAVANTRIRQYDHDLLVEDFGAPFSLLGSPAFTKSPVIASVQWMFAKEMRTKYHLPFDLAERTGLRLYNNFIAVSHWLGRELTTKRPNAKVEVIPNGVEEAAFSVDGEIPTHLLFVGRLDINQKGGDMLIEIAAKLLARMGDQMPPLIIVGDGPDRGKMEQRAAQLGLFPKVEFRGRVEGLEKYRLMASAYAVLMPSRHETFGMVAVESQAAGTPVISFDIGPLSEVVFGGRAQLISAFDLDAFAAKAIDLIADTCFSQHIRNAGRQWARKYNWDELALRQECHYLHAVSREMTSHYNDRNSKSL